MPKYLLSISYTREGAQGLIKEGGTGRRDAISKAIQSIGGSIESFYYAYGERDAYLIADAPSETALLSLSLTVAAGGGARFSTHQLFTPEEVDSAVRTSADYRPPGT